MWPPKFAQQSSSNTTSPIGSRQSPAVSRRSSNIGPYLQSTARPNFSPRSSSLNLAPKGGTPSIQITTSSLRSQLNTVTPDAETPARALEDLLGASVPKNATPTQPQLLNGIDFGGKSLTDFLLDNSESQGPRHTLQAAEAYVSNSERFHDLHDSIAACDQILESVEASLSQFQINLGSVSAEIENLQNRSLGLETRLGNRKIVEKLLGPAVEQLTIAPALVRTILKGTIDSEWCNAVTTLDKRLKSIDGHSTDTHLTRAADGVKPLLSDLADFATERIRDFFIAQIKALRTPNINSQISQQQSFLPFKDIYAFLCIRQPQLGEQLLRAYIHTMRWYYKSLFSRYFHGLAKIPLHSSDGSNALGATKSGSSASNQHTATTTVLGRRGDLLRQHEFHAMPLHVAFAAKSSSYVETPFHAITSAIVENASAEYGFLASFLPVNALSVSVPNTFEQVFHCVYDLGSSMIRQLIDSNSDSIGLLLCVRIIQHHAFVLQRRKCPVVDGWINGTTMLLWPRFQQSMDAHVASVRKSNAHISFTGMNKASLSLAGTGKGDESKSSLGTAPHPITQRFGNLLQGLVALSDDTMARGDGGDMMIDVVDAEPVKRSICRVRDEVVSFLIKLAQGMGVNQAKKNRFLSNNYSLIITILAETTGKLATEQRRWFEERRDQCSD